MSVFKIALTGGPCGGKTTSIQRIEEEFTEKGYRVIVVPEAATILINMGIKPFGDKAIPIMEFQRLVIDLQLKLEDIARRSVREDEDVIILCDRGIIDDKAYVSHQEFRELIEDINMSEIDLFNEYDLVIHLKSAADGKEEFYTLSNNTARSESPEEARARDQLTLEAWLGHDNLKIIGNETGFDEKIDSVVQKIYEALNKPYPIQSQRKYLVDNVQLDRLGDIKLVKLHLEQYYRNTECEDIMYRKTVKDEASRYNITIKSDTSINSERITKKKHITEEDYYEGLKNDDVFIVKDRYCFAYKNQYFRLDIFDDSVMVLEIEETNKTKNIEIPPFITVSQCITNNVMYRNSTLYGLKKEMAKVKVKK